MEEWKDVKGFEGIYQISNQGRLRSMERFVKCRGENFRRLPSQIMKPMYSSQGYLNHRVTVNGKSTTLFIHRLVAEHFLNCDFDEKFVDHIDRNKTNNHASNLRFVSPKENMRNRSDNKLDFEKVSQIKSLLKNMTQKEIAKMFNVRQSMISRIKTGDRWADV